CEIWKSADGTDWIEQDSANNPSCHTSSSAALAVDSNDKLHALFIEGTDIKYIPFSSGSFGSQETVFQMGFAPYVYATSIAIDSNDVPHVAFDYDIITAYTNRVGGSWKTPVNIYTEPHSPDLLINEDNIPEIVFNDGLSAALRASVGNA